MLIFAEMTWNAPDVLVSSFQCHSCVLVDSIQDSNFSLGIQTKVGIIWLRLWRGSVAALHFDWSIGNRLTNQNVKRPCYHATDDLTAGAPRLARLCLDFGFQHARIRNNWSKKFGVEYWALPGSNSPWRHYTALIIAMAAP